MNAVDVVCGRPPERGQVTLLGLGLVLVVLFIGGLAVDLARVFSERRALAELADAAAAAGANGIDVVEYRRSGSLRLDPGVAERLAEQSIADQADDRSRRGPPAIDTSDEVIIVRVRGEVPLTLLRLFTFGEPFEVEVRAEAGPRRGPAG